ncbi:unnamed protein product [Camellia sinensis]
MSRLDVLFELFTSIHPFNGRASVVLRIIFSNQALTEEEKVEFESEMCESSSSNSWRNVSGRWLSGQSPSPNHKASISKPSYLSSISKSPAETNDLRQRRPTNSDLRFYDIITAVALVPVAKSEKREPRQMEREEKDKTREAKLWNVISN